MASYARYIDDSPGAVQAAPLRGTESLPLHSGAKGGVAFLGSRPRLIFLQI